MKLKAPVRHRMRLRGNPNKHGCVVSLTKDQLKCMRVRVGDRVWIRRESGRVVFSRLPRGPRPSDGRVSARLRRARLRRIAYQRGVAFWWRARQQGRRRAAAWIQTYRDTRPRDGGLDLPLLTGVNGTPNSAGTGTARLAASA